MTKEYKTLVKTTNNENLGLAIQGLIEDNIARINTSFLAEIKSINGNKVSICEVIKRKQTDITTIYNNCLVGFNHSGKWQTQFKLKVGDIGLAIVLQDDISGYKSTGKNGLNKTGRIHDKNDAVFIPFSLFDTLPNDSINFIIENDVKSCKLEFDNAEMGTFKAKLLTLESENTTLKTKLLELSSILQSAMIMQTPSGIQPFDGATKSAFSGWSSGLDDLFKD